MPAPSTKENPSSLALKVTSPSLVSVEVRCPVASMVSTESMKTSVFLSMMVTTAAPAPAMESEELVFLVLLELVLSFVMARAPAMVTCLVSFNARATKPATTNFERSCMVALVSSSV